MREQIERRLGQLLEKGNELKPPVSTSLKGGLFELKARSGRQRARLIYFFSGNDIVIVHALIKKTAAIPENDLKIAIRNMKLIERGEEVPNDFDYIN